MTFTSFNYFYFFLCVVSIYWLLGKKRWQNPFLLGASYLFYGFIHPWFCLLILISTLTDYFCALKMEKGNKRLYLWASLLVNLGMLGGFKYFNFFVGSAGDLFEFLGWKVSLPVLKVVLPVGISFYTFQTLSYTLDVYWGRFKPIANFVDFSLYVSFFPQLVAGPIERATTLAPQIALERKWSTVDKKGAFSLFISGYVKKLVVADNVSPFVDQVFMLAHPDFFLLFVGSVLFAIQIWADFSAYTDIARASAKCLGFELMENFNAPYLAVSPSDFWRRWHISFSSWIRDYLYIPLGGSRVGAFRYFFVVVGTMSVSGLWHGAAWNFVVWGVFHGCLLYFYKILKIEDAKKGIPFFIAWIVMQGWTLVGWAIFRTDSLGWLFFEGTATLSRESLLSGCYFLVMGGVYLSIWSLGKIKTAAFEPAYLQLGLAVLLANPDPQAFIYFQF